MYKNKGEVLGRARPHRRSFFMAFEQSIHLDPNHAVTHYDKGVTLGDLGRYEEALAAYNRHWV